MRDTVALIDRVHGDGRLPTIPMVRTPPQGYEGRFAVLPDGRPARIEVSQIAGEPLYTSAHETGHFLDLWGMGTGTWASESDPRLQEWRDAIDQTAAVRRLHTLQRTMARQIAFADSSGAVIARLPVDQSYVAYGLSRQELWARSYAQYIATRSGDPALLQQLKVRRTGLANTLLYSFQWEDADFALVADALDRLFQTLGWQQ